MFGKKILRVIGGKLEIKNELHQQGKQDTNEEIPENFIHERAVSGKNSAAKLFILTTVVFISIKKSLSFLKGIFFIVYQKILLPDNFT